MGRMTASLRDSLAASSPATSDQATFGVSDRIAPGESKRFVRQPCLLVRDEREGKVRTAESSPHLLRLRIVLIVLLCATPSAGSLATPVRADADPRPFLVPLGEVLLELLGSVQVLGKLLSDELLELIILLVCNSGRLKRCGMSGLFEL